MATPGAVVIGPPERVPAGAAPAPAPAPKAEPEAELPRSRPSVVRASPRPSVAKQAPADPFERLLQALSDVALHMGATRVAATLPNLFAGGATDAAPRARELVAVGAAWRDVLCGTTGDLSACGALMLDEWGAELLNELMGRPSGASRELRQKLRERGVAAFGFRDAA